MQAPDSFGRFFYVVSQAFTLLHMDKAVVNYEIM